MRLLVLADEESWLPLPALVRSHAPDAVITLGDLVPDTLDPLGRFPGLPVLGVYGNHDDGTYLDAANATNLHLRAAAVGGVTFAGFQGCVKYTPGFVRLQYSQREAKKMARRLPRADVLVSHAPPRGVHEEPDDRAHEGFEALRAYVERVQPRLALHGHTPAPPRRAVRIGATKVVHVVGAQLVDVPV